MNIILRFIDDDSGATAIEYSLIASLIAAAIVGAISLLSTHLDTSYTTIAAAIP